MCQLQIPHEVPLKAYDQILRANNALYITVYLLKAFLATRFTGSAFAQAPMPQPDPP